MDLLHPKIVHLPIALAVLMPILAGVVWFAWRRGSLPKRAWWLVVGAQIMLAVSGFASMQTGEHDEERVERFVGDAAIDEHEDAAKVFMAGTFAVLLLAGGALLFRREERARAVAAVSVLGTLAVLGLGYRVGQAGGALVYEHGAANAFMPAGAAAEFKANADTQRASDAETEDRDDDDDD